ncbi:MAG: DUF294 nucleotidyltransferase-like domain-containing protein, partial [Pseudomonadota bacterium]
YVHLRRVEHAIQMIADEQTHILPADPDQQAAVAGLLGYAEVDAFRDDLERTLRTVEHHFGDLFSEGETLSAFDGSLVFTGQSPDPDTVETLARLGYERPKDMWGVVSGWHFGRYAAVQSQKARERLTELTPALLEAFAAAKAPDDALLRFDAFVRGLPAGVQLFSMLHANTQLLTLLARILISAPRLSDIIANRPSVFAGLLEPAFFDQTAPEVEIEAALDAFLHDADGHEAVLDRLRIFAAEQRFRVGTRLLMGSDNALETGKALTLIAEKTIAVAAQSAASEIEAKHGRIPGGAFCVIAFGRLGSREMTAGSDVDIIVVYDDPDDLIESDGAKPLAPPTYYARLTQRLIAALSAPTAEGVLYEVDLRLRPSGNKGPIATSMRSFDRYQRNDAWTWEHQALTRARVIAGDEALCARARTNMDDILALPRDADNVRADVTSMRKRLLKEKPGRGSFDFKNLDGGLIDIDFIAQSLFLTTLPNLKLDGASARDILMVLEDGVLRPGVRSALLAAHQDFSTALHLSRLCTSGGYDPSEMPSGLVDIVCHALGEPSLTLVQDRLDSHRREVAKSFRELVGDPTE